MQSYSVLPNTGAMRWCKMNKIILPSVFAATILIAAAFAIMPVDRASSVHTTIAAQQRPINTVTDVQVTGTNKFILLDNAGIGGVADVELTWRFSDLDCQVETSTDQTVPIDVFTVQTNDGAFGGNPPHRDVSDIEAVAIGSDNETAIDGDGICDMDHASGDFVTVSVIGT